MGSGKIYFYSPGIRLGCLDARTGQVRWKTEAEGLLEAIGPNPGVQHYLTGYATSTYIKSGEVLATLPQRRACTRATGSLDSIFFRAQRSTIPEVDIHDVLVLDFQ